MKLDKAWRALALVCVMGLVVAACGGDDNGNDNAASGGGNAPKELTKLKVGVVPVVDVAPLYLGIKKGFFKDEGLDVTPVVAQGGAAIIPAVVNGDQQIGFSNIVSLLLGQTQNLPVQVISQGVQATDDPDNDTAAIAVKGDSPIKTAADLEGKTIAINTLKNISELTVKAALDGEGVDVSTLKFVEVPLPDMVGQLDAGRVDAAGLVEPFITTGKAAGDRTLIYDRVATEPKMTVATYFTSKSFLGSDPDTVDAFVKAMNKSLEYATDHPDEARAAIGEYTEIPPDVLAKVVLPLWQTDLNRDSIDKINELMVKYGIAEKKADVDALIAENAK
ncbi:MAG TPA: ABC transporter substrate-binding protein [Acidimicrobiales bacterium]|nr:ABC transporter substrate-binding protein [Acidimicrobiales bacterium]